jgi:hypothetical protein
VATRKGGVIVVTLRSPAAGRWSLRATYRARSGRKTKTITYGTGARSAAAAGTTTVTLRPGKTGKSRLRRGSGRLKLVLRAAFTPKRGKAVIVTRSVTARR